MNSPCVPADRTRSAVVSVVGAFRGVRLFTRSLALACLGLGCLPGVAASIESPDGRVRLEFSLNEVGGGARVRYDVSFAGEPVLRGAEIAFETDSGDVIGEHLELKGVSETSVHDSGWKPVYGERSTVRDHYRRIELDAVDSVSGHAMRVEFRCYDAGVAYHVTLRSPDADSLIRITAERSRFCFTGDHIAWWAPRAQDSYRRTPLSEIQGRVERPLTIQSDRGFVAAIAEARLIDYSTMQLRLDEQDPHCVVSRLGGAVEGRGAVQTPWRVVMLGDSAGDLLEKNDLLLNLSDPCAIEDTSWIKPGKVLREVTLTTKGAKACIDFAHKNGIQYIEFDAGWYGNEYSDSSDATTVSLDAKRSAGPLDLRWAIDYGKQHGVGIIVYVNRRALERQLDQVLSLYQEWGIAGVKYGFVNTESQRWTRWLHEAVKKAAEHQLMVDVHDEYRPTGFSRTYPNLMTQEGVRGDEATPSGSQAVTTLFTRSLAGAADHTICYFDPRVDGHWTHGHQLAKAVCIYSPWQFLFWYDSPLARGPNERHNHLVDAPELEFFARVPTVWDETRVLKGEIGQIAVIARRSGDDWFIGALNGDRPQAFRLPLSMLTPGARYTARSYSDDPDLTTKTRVRIDSREVDSESDLALRLLANGGQAVWITPTEASAVTARLPGGASARSDRVSQGE